MARKIKKTLFSKNHITISKTKNVDHTTPYVEFKIISNGSVCVPCTRKTIDVIKESPLGFKYKTKETVKIDNSVNTEDKFIVNVYLKKEEYEIVYPIVYGENRVDNETRPWDIVEGDKSMPEHFIFDLKKVIDDIFDIIEGNKLQIVDRYNTTYPYSMSYQELHDKIYVHLFGNKKGIRFQTDDEKILSHGFDKITSFRKM